MSTISFKRLAKSLHKIGIEVSYSNEIYQLTKKSSLGETSASVLLPENLPLEKKAVEQLLAFAGTYHPSGCCVQRTIATPDFHSGSLVPVGAVVATTPDMLIPQAIGTDIHCGMRLHMIDLDYDVFQNQKDIFVDKLKSDLLLGTRNLPLNINSFISLFDDGISNWIDVQARTPLEQFKKMDFNQLKTEMNKIFELGNEKGNHQYAPNYLTTDKRDTIRDSYLATLGGGNHFLEIQRVHEIYDRKTAYAWGIKKNQLALMIHTGSRSVGVHVGNYWQIKAKQSWPKGHKHPEGGIYPLYGRDAHEYLTALHTASHYAKLNRLLIAELAKINLRDVFASDLEIPLFYDAPHNIITKENDQFIHRKGATPAFLNQPVLIPGSMGDLSFVMKGLGNDSFLQSASHGAGRAFSRFDISQKHRSGIDVGLKNIECITLKEERQIEEAPLAYKNINDVIKIQQEHGIVSPVASLEPIMTFKG